MALSPLFPFSERARALHAELDQFIRDRVLPAEAGFDAHLEQPGQRWTIPPVVETLKAEAEVASFRNVTEYREVPIVSGGGPNLPRQFPELRPPRIPSAAAVRAAFHQSTNEERP